MPRPGPPRQTAVVPARRGWRLGLLAALAALAFVASLLLLRGTDQVSDACRDALGSGPGTGRLGGAVRSERAQQACADD